MFSIGDKVRLNKNSATAIVFGVYGEFVWLKFRDNDQPQTRRAADYEAAED